MKWFHLGGIAVVVSLAASVALASEPNPRDVADDQPAPEVHVIGVYEGTYPEGVRHRGNFHPDGAATVRMAGIKKPATLVLTSYEPVVWTIDDPQAVVVRVIASGYHRQSVAGLGENVPVTLFSHDAGDRDYFYAYRQEPRPTDSEHEQADTRKKYERLVQRVKQLTGQGFASFQGKYRGRTFEVRPPLQLRVPKGECEVHALGVYEGTYLPGVRHSGNFHPGGSVSVKLGAAEKPIILVLSAYEPVVWKLEGAKNTVVWVIASGYYQQKVEGLEEGVPVTLLSHEDSDEDYFYAYRQEPRATDSEHEQADTRKKYERLVQRVKQLTGQGFASFQGKYRGRTFDVRPPVQLRVPTGEREVHALGVYEGEFKGDTSVY